MQYSCCLANTVINNERRVALPQRKFVWESIFEIFSAVILILVELDSGYGKD